MSKLLENNCEIFLAHIDLWLDGELEDTTQKILQNQFECQLENYLKSHLESCEECQQEIHLASTIQVTLRELPEIECSLQLIDADSFSKEKTWLASFQQLVLGWREPFIIFSTLLIVLSTVLFFRHDYSNSIPHHRGQRISFNGEKFTLLEISMAAEELRLALSYLNKYESYTQAIIKEGIIESSQSITGNLKELI